MLVTFRSTATGSVTMFGEHARALLKLMGASGTVPGALDAGDVTAALHRLERAIDELRTRAPEEDGAADKRTGPLGAGAEDEEKDEEDREPPIALETRAVPLIELLRDAAAAHAEVMWQ